MPLPPFLKQILTSVLSYSFLILVSGVVYIPFLLWRGEGRDLAKQMSFSLRGSEKRKTERVRVKAGPENLFLGFRTHTQKPIYLPNFLRAEHILVLGSTGTGKTTSSLEPAVKSDIQAGRGLVFLTGKEEPDFIARIIAYAVEAGRTHDIRLLTFSESFPSHSYNPLIYGNETALRDLCMGAFHWDQPYYRDQSKSALLYVLSALVETGRTFTLKDLYYLFNEKGCLEILAEMTKEPEVRHHLKSYLDDWKTFRENTRGLSANLEDYTTKRLASRVCAASPEIDLVEAHQNNRIVIFVLNSLQYGETAQRLGKMILQNLRYLSGKVAEEGPEKFFPVYIDEFHHFVYPEFFSMVAQCRSANIGLILSTQSFSDMKGPDWDITTQMIQNTNTKIILRQNEAKSAEMTAKLAGTQTVMLHTQQTENHWLWGNQNTGLGSVRPEEEFVINPNVIRRLNTGRAVLLVRGHAELIQLVPASFPRFEESFDQWRGNRTSQESLKIKNYPPALDIYGLWMAREEERKGQGIKRPKVHPAKETPPDSEASKGLETLRRTAKLNK